MSLLQEIAVPIIIVVIVIVVPVVAVALLNRGKQLKCPDCGKVFKAPLMDQKTFGIGWTFPYVGKVSCSHCGVAHSRRAYQKVERQPKQA